MSYVLSALKKSTEERKKGEVPNLLTSMPSQEKLVVKEGTPFVLNKSYLIFSAIAGSVLILAWAIFFMRHGDSVALPTLDPPGTPSIQPVETNRAALSKPGAVQSTPIPRERFVSQPQRPQSPESAPVTSVLPTVPAANAPVSTPGMRSNAAFPFVGNTPTDEVVEYSRLPQALQESLPPLELSGHFYSEKRPTIRKVIINGKTLRENQYITADLMIKEIIADGVILEYQSQAFKIHTDQIFQ